MALFVDFVSRPQPAKTNNPLPLTGYAILFTIPSAGHSHGTKIQFLYATEFTPQTPHIIYPAINARESPEP